MIIIETVFAFGFMCLFKSAKQISLAKLIQWEKMKCLCPNLIFSMPLVQMDITRLMTIDSAEYVMFRILIKL